MGNWTKKEDETLTESVKKYGPRNWTRISKNLPGRIGKQCRERWHNHLDPCINKRKWSLEEDLLIVRLHLVERVRWCEMTKQLAGRTDSAIKNRFNSNLKKRLNEPIFAKVLNEPPRCSLVDFEDSVTLENDLSNGKDRSTLALGGHEAFKEEEASSERQINVFKASNQQISACKNRREAKLETKYRKAEFSLSSAQISTEICYGEKDMSPKMANETVQEDIYHDSSLRQEATPPALSYPLNYNLARHFGSSRVSPITKSVISYATPKQIVLSPSESMAKSTNAPLSFVSTARKSPYELKFMQNPPHADSPYKRHKTTSTVSKKL